MDKKVIKVGRALVPTGRKTIDGQTVSGWALPGGAFTTVREHAKATAERMDKCMRAKR